MRAAGYSCVAMPHSPVPPARGHPSRPAPALRVGVARRRQGEARSGSRWAGTAGPIPSTHAQRTVEAAPEGHHGASPAEVARRLHTRLPALREASAGRWGIPPPLWRTTRIDVATAPTTATPRPSTRPCRASSPPRGVIAPSQPLAQRAAATREPLRLTRAAPTAPGRGRRPDRPRARSRC
jgi:hypothetical protein